VGTHAELITYDTDGNTTERAASSANPMPPVTDPADYTYNSSGQRSMKHAAGDKIFHYDLSGQLIAQTDVQGNMIKAYVWQHGQPLAQIVAGGGVCYYHNDHLGTPRKMTDSSAGVVWAADYLPFGQADVIVENELLSYLTGNSVESRCTYLEMIKDDKKILFLNGWPMRSLASF
jgi:uncharacterized protein RhaS with RHS repeats